MVALAGPCEEGAICLREREHATTRVIGARGDETNEADVIAECKRHQL